MSDEPARKRRKLCDGFYENCSFLENEGIRANDGIVMDGYFVEHEGEEMLSFFNQFAIIYKAFIDHRPNIDGHRISAVPETIPFVHVDDVIKYVENLLSEHNDIVIAAVSYPGYGQGDMDETPLFSCLLGVDPLPILLSYRKVFVGGSFWVSHIHNLRQYFQNMGKVFHSVVSSDTVDVNIFLNIIKATCSVAPIVHFLNGSGFDTNWSIFNLEGYSIVYDLVFSMVSHCDVAKFSVASKYANYLVHGLDSSPMLMNRSSVMLYLLITEDQVVDGHSTIRMCINDEARQLKTVFGGFSFVQHPSLSLVGVFDDLLVFLDKVGNQLAYYNTSTQKSGFLDLPCVGDLVVKLNTFGVGCHNGDYLICLVQRFEGDSERGNVFLYSFNDCAWTDLSFKAVVRKDSGVYVKGKFFFVEDGDIPGILAYEVAAKKLHAFRVSNGVFSYGGIGHIWGELFVVELREDCIWIRVMDSDKLTLRKIWIIEDLELINDCWLLKPVMFLADGSMLFLRNCVSLISYCARLKLTSLISAESQACDCFSYSGAFFNSQIGLLL